MTIQEALQLVTNQEDELHIFRIQDNGTEHIWIATLDEKVLYKTRSYTAGEPITDEGTSEEVDTLNLTEDQEKFLVDRISQASIMNHPFYNIEKEVTLNGVTINYRY